VFEQMKNHRKRQHA